MGCGKTDHSRNCVCKVLREISQAQRNVIETECDTSCKKSIKDLLGEKEVRNELDTIPLILYCKDSCKPFKGFGARSKYIGEVVSSFYFRVKKVDKDCCATLELLRDPHDVVSTSDHKKKANNPKDPTDQRTKNLQRTGICMTVDLHCFCHVTCLPAISTLR